MRRMVRSLKVPGSPSAPFTTTVVGSVGVLFSMTVRHLRPVGKPAPPRPRNPAASSSSITATRSTARAFSRPWPPPILMYSARSATGWGYSTRWTMGMPAVSRAGAPRFELRELAEGGRVGQGHLAGGPQQGLLADGGDEHPVPGVHRAPGQPARPVVRHRIDREEQPLVGPGRTVEPDGVVEAGAHELRRQRGSGRPGAAH